MKKMALAVGLFFVCIDMQGASQDTGADSSPKIGDLSLWKKKGDKAVFGLINTNYQSDYQSDYQSEQFKVLVKGCCGVLAVTEKNGVLEYSIELPQFSFEIWYGNIQAAQDNINRRLLRLNPSGFYFHALLEAKKARRDAQRDPKDCILVESKENCLDDLARLFYATALTQIEEFKKKE